MTLCCILLHSIRLTISKFQFPCCMAMPQRCEEACSFKYRFVYICFLKHYDQCLDKRMDGYNMNNDGKPFSPSYPIMPIMNIWLVAVCTYSTFMKNTIEASTNIFSLLCCLIVYRKCHFNETLRKHLILRGGLF